MVTLYIYNRVGTLCLSNPHMERELYKSLYWTVSVVASLRQDQLFQRSSSSNSINCKNSSSDSFNSSYSIVVEKKTKPL